MSMQCCDCLGGLGDLGDFIRGASILSRGDPPACFLCSLRETTFLNVPPRIGVHPKATGGFVDPSGGLCGRHWVWGTSKKLTTVELPFSMGGILFHSLSVEVSVQSPPSPPVAGDPSPSTSAFSAPAELMPYFS